MNRHSSNPFLSDWDDVPSSQQQDITSAIQQARSMVPNANDQDVAKAQQHSQRRSSCSQAELNDSSGQQSATGSVARQGLYRRNMSSFEAASLQLERHQQQMLENGSANVPVTHKDLIAKMTAEFQSAINTNDKQFALDASQVDFDPFDPFETIVDDDVSLPSPVPSNNSNKLDELQQAAESANNSRKHDSIDDDDEELVSTPVRNIKSSALEKQQQHHQGQQQQHNIDDDYDRENSLSNNSDDYEDQIKKRTSQQLDGSDSREKASLFASLLASAENTNSPETAKLDEDLEQNELVEEATHVIKGSPQSAGGDIERPVGFFDPFETVIDKDALCELMNGTSTGANQNLDTNSEQKSTSNEQHHYDDKINLNTKPPSTLGLNDRQSKLANRAVAESASIETVIENTVKVASDLDRSIKSETADQEEATASNKSSQVIERNSSVDDHDDNQTKELDENRQEDSRTSEAPTRMTTYDSSMALGRPTGRRLEQPSSGIVAPQPTPLRRPKQKASANSGGNKQKASFMEDSSDSDEEDDRIQIVIKAKEDRSDLASANGDGSASNHSRQPVPLVPLLPPPPSKNSMKQARERGQVEDMPSPIMNYKLRHNRAESQSSDDGEATGKKHAETKEIDQSKLDEGLRSAKELEDLDNDEDQDEDQDDGQFVIPMRPEDLDDLGGIDHYGKSDTPLYDDDTSYVLEEFPSKYDGPGWEMMLRYPPKKKLTSNRFWKKIFVKLAQVPLVIDSKAKQIQQQQQGDSDLEPQFCWALQIFDKLEDKKPMQEIPIQATYTVSEISSQLFDQFGKIFTIKLQYIFYKERVGVRHGQLARFIHTGHIGTSTTSGGHGVDPISIGAIKRMGAPIEHSPQVSQIIKLGCTSYEDIKIFKEALEDCLFRMPIHRDRALSTYKTEEVQMAVRDETYIEVNQIGTITRQLARVRLFFLSFLNGQPTVEVGINDIHRQGREVVGRMDILPVVTEEWIRLEAWELHSTVEAKEFENVDLRIIKLSPPDATFFELMRFRVRPPRNRELPLQVSANMSVTRTKVSINCEVMIPGCVSRKHGQIPCENIAIRIHIPECWIYFFREEKHFRMGSKKSVNRRPGKVKGIERFLGGGGGLQDIDDESSLIEVTSGQAKYEHHHHAVVWRAARWPKESQTAYVQNTMKIRLPLTAYDKMPESFSDSVQVEYTMPATTVSHTTLRSISVNPCDDEPPEKYVKYSAKYEYKVKMRLSVNLGSGAAAGGGGGAQEPESSPIVIMRQPELRDDPEKEPDSDEDDEEDDDEEDYNSDADHHQPPTTR